MADGYISWLRVQNVAPDFGGNAKTAKISNYEILLMASALLCA